MSIKKYILGLFAALTLSGCINNDIPYPTIVGLVEKMTIEGQTELKIDASTRTITVKLADTVDLRSVVISSFVVTDDSRSTIDSGEVIDLTDGKAYKVGEPFEFTISTFQDYKWKIVAEQVIEQDITMSGSIGKAQFDEQKLTAIVKVAQSQDLYSIVVEKFVLGPSNATYTPNPLSISNFREKVKIDVEFFGIKQTWTIAVQYSNENVVTGKVNAFGRFAYLAGDVLPTSTLSAGFEVREAKKDVWRKVDAKRVGGKIEAVVTGLEPNMEYICRARLGEEYGAEETFKTEITPVIANLNFDEAYLSDVKWYFNANPPGGNSFWATGNEGVSILKKSNTISVAGNEAVTGRAVRMETLSGVPMVVIAAGNIFTGNYATNMAKPELSVNFGRPYTGRPTGLSGWFRYSPKNVSGYRNETVVVDVNGKPETISFKDSIGKPDWAHIYMVLEKWPDGWDVSNPGKRPAENLVTRVAYGEFRTKSEVSTYSKFSFPLVYSDLVLQPDHIVLIATSSINGGLFCGGAGSTLYVDDFEFLFEPVI